MILIFNDGESITRKEIDEHLMQHFVAWRLSEDFNVVENIAATSVGKIDKEVILREHQIL